MCSQNVLMIIMTCVACDRASQSRAMPHAAGVFQGPGWRQQVGESKVGKGPPLCQAHSAMQAGLGWHGASLGPRRCAHCHSPFNRALYAPHGARPLPQRPRAAEDGGGEPGPSGDGGGGEEGTQRRRRARKTRGGRGPGTARGTQR